VNYHSLRVLTAIAMRPSIALAQHQSRVRQAVERHRAANPRVFGSTLHGNDQDGSDLDLLVDALPGATMFDLGGLQDELEMLLGLRVDVLTPSDLPVKFRSHVLAEAQPL
jgi:predicted nucleotidyltransferase